VTTSREPLATLEEQTSDARLDGISRLIGNTPMLAVDCALDGEPRTVYAKLESMNWTGSVKDRMALHIIQCAYQSGMLRPGALVVEATSGNTGISFAALGRALGHPVAIFIPDWMSGERIALIRSFGAEVHLVSRAQGGFLGSIAMAEGLAAHTANAFLPRQFSNADNSEAHELTTGPEILTQLRMAGLARTRSWPASAPAARSWERGATCARTFRP
jgi:cysteine synthase A